MIELPKKKNQPGFFSFRSNDLVQEAMRIVAEYHGLSCGAFIRYIIMMELRQVPGYEQGIKKI